MYTKLVSEKEGLAQLRILRWSRGRLLLFTNGCFDVFHAGHARMFDWIGDNWNENAILVVGINTDASVAKLKPGRPINTLQDRAAVLQMIRGVTLVVPFSGKTPLALIKAFQPRILIKGADYKDKPVVGANHVASWGGRVEFAPYFHGISTTEIAKKCAAFSQPS